MYVSIDFDEIMKSDVLKERVEHCINNLWVDLNFVNVHDALKKFPQLNNGSIRWLQQCFIISVEIEELEPRESLCLLNFGDVHAYETASARNTVFIEKPLKPHFFVV